MKKISYILVFLGLTTFTQCNFTNLNVDPNRVTNEVVGVEYRLPAFQYLLMETMANNVVKRVGNTVGYTFYRQGPTGLNDYIYTAADGSNISLWEKLYLAMNSGHGLLERAEKEKKVYYRGIAKILMAASLGLTSSIYGDIPYSQAFQPEKYVFPVFDSQDQIYTQIQQLLDDAITDLTSANGGKRPGADDIMFNGDLGRWVKTAYGLKARYYLHTIKVNPDAYTLASSALTNALASNDDNCILNFEIGQTGQQHP
ncbi:MAG: SusD/RagB family nutrient-binding outer membrane lipoprotein, partial [Cytophagales bacterium]|nr:SusD/RagB family nutrient-binding outer membrane lipoprotein [Cytophagales bacterium]